MRKEEDDFVTCGGCFATVPKDDEVCNFCNTEINENTIITKEDINDDDGTQRHEGNR